MADANKYKFHFIDQASKVKFLSCCPNAEWDTFEKPENKSRQKFLRSWFHVTSSTLYTSRHNSS